MAKKRRSLPLTPSRKRERFVAQLPDLRQVLRGSVVTRFRRCGQSSCHCARKRDPGHGPAFYLMVTVEAGKTVQVYIPSEHKDEVAAWVENFQRARRRLEEVSTLNRALLKRRRLFRGG